MESGFRCVVMWEGCDGLLKSSSQVMRGVKERHGAGEALKQPVYGGFHRISCVGLLWCWLVWSGEEGSGAWPAFQKFTVTCDRMSIIYLQL